MLGGPVGGSHRPGRSARIAGSVVDQALFGAESQRAQGPRLDRSARHGLDRGRADPAL